MEGYVPYHVTSEFDFTTNTLVNTGTQFFSGTIAESDPVVLHDDEFRFVLDLTTGADTGEVHFGGARTHRTPRGGTSATWSW